MTPWTGVVLALPGDGDDAMASRLPAWLHPVAGRPLVWHVASLMAELDPPPARVLVLAGTDLPEDLFHDLPIPVEVLPGSVAGRVHPQLESLGEDHSALVVHAAATWEPGALRALLAAPAGVWLAAEDVGAVAAWVAGTRLAELLRLPSPLHAPNGVLAAHDRLPGGHPASVVRNRIQLADATRRVRDRLVCGLMLGGATFVLPESVSVDVDVRIGRDSIIYPGAVLEGQTTIGEETVIGPGCRIIDSWVGSGVELKGWNYVSHTSVRNRAILEPYVRRGFD